MKNKVMILILVVCTLLFTGTVHARSLKSAKEPIDLSKICELTLDYSSDGVSFAGISVKLYKIASVSENCRYTLTDNFAASNVTINGITSQSEWNTVRTTVESFVYSSGVGPVCESVIAEDGSLKFSGLDTGLYFVPAVIAEHDGFRYYFQSAIISLPDLNEDGTWNYSVEADPKPDVRPPSSTDLEYKVVKLWKGDGKLTRPADVTIDIIKDGEVVATVVLSDDNGWSYTWNAADDGSVWTVAERNVAAGYTVSVDKNETTFSVINTYDKPPVDAPQTGDTYNIGLYIVLMCVSGIGLVLFGIKRKSEA